MKYVFESLLMEIDRDAAWTAFKDVMIGAGVLALCVAVVVMLMLF